MRRAFLLAFQPARKENQFLFDASAFLYNKYMEFEILLAILMLLVSLLTTVGLPGPLIISLIVLGYAYTSDFQSISLAFTIFYLFLGVAGIVIDNLFSIFGAKKFGASKYGFMGAFFGTLSIFVLGPIGIIVGPFAGAFIGETIFARKNLNKAVISSFGAVVGMLTGIMAKVLLALLMTLGFTAAIFYF